MRFHATWNLRFATNHSPSCCSYDFRGYEVCSIQERNKEFSVKKTPEIKDTRTCPEFESKRLEEL